MKGNNSKYHNKNWKKLEEVGKLCYLGTITNDAKSHVDIERRITMVQVSSIEKTLIRGKLSKNLKNRVIKSMIWSVVLYGSKKWTLTKADIKRWEAFEMWIWQMTERVNWMELRTSEQILQMVEEKRSLEWINPKRQRQSLGRMMRGIPLN